MLRIMLMNKNYVLKKESVVYILLKSIIDETKYSYSKNK